MFLRARRRENVMGYQPIYQYKRCDDERDAGDLVEAVNKFYRYFVAEFIGVKCFGSVEPELYDKDG